MIRKLRIFLALVPPDRSLRDSLKLINEVTPDLRLTWKAPRTCLSAYLWPRSFVDNPLYLSDTPIKRSFMAVLVHRHITLALR